MLTQTQKLYESVSGAKFRRGERIGKAMNEGTFDFCPDKSGQKSMGKSEWDSSRALNFVPLCGISFLALSRKENNNEC